MPNPIDISASSMTGLLGAVEASKASRLKPTPGPSTGDDYNLSRFKKGSAISKGSSKSKDHLQKYVKGSNRGVEDRKEKDLLGRTKANRIHMPPSVQDQLAVEALERKAKIYEATVRGEAGGLTEKQLEFCALDIDAKRADAQRGITPDSDDSDHEPGLPSTSFKKTLESCDPPTSFKGRLSSKQENDVPHSPMMGEKQRNEEEWIETKDEFGRDILIPASSIKPTVSDPQRTLNFSQTESASQIQDIGVRYGPQTSFPELPRLGPIKKPTEAEPIDKYFDPNAERRQLGTGFYALSKDPLERERQQAELRAREAETEKARSNLKDDPSKSVSTQAQSALESRKRQIQLKREELARKRAKPLNQA